MWYLVSRTLEYILNGVSLHNLCHNVHIQSLNCLILKKSWFSFNVFFTLWLQLCECVNYFCCSLFFKLLSEIYMVRRMTVYVDITRHIYFNLWHFFNVVLDKDLNLLTLNFVCINKFSCLVYFCSIWIFILVRIQPSICITLPSVNIN